MNQIPDTALILVAILPNKKDFEIARMLGWYRIPLRMAPKMIDVDYLAFYQTGVFGEGHKCMIEYLAPVTGHELTTRSALLRDEPHHPRAGEEYFKIQLGPLEKLHSPIIAENWKRITFFYSLGSLLNSAQTVNDLVLQSEDKQMLWKIMRDRSSRGYQSSAVAPELEFSDEQLMTLLAGFSQFSTLHSDEKEQSDLDSW